MYVNVISRDWGGACVYE